MMQILEFIILGQSSASEITKLQSEIRELKALQHLTSERLSDLSRLDKIERTDNNSKWVVGLVIVILVGGMVAFAAYQNAEHTTATVDSLSREFQLIIRTVSDQITSSSTTNNNANGARIEALTKLLEKIENRLSTSMQRLSEQMARSNDVRFDSNQFFARR